MCLLCWSKCRHSQTLAHTLVSNDEHSLAPIRSVPGLSEALQDEVGAVKSVCDSLLHHSCSSCPRTQDLGLLLMWETLCNHCSVAWDILTTVAPCNYFHALSGGNMPS